jgi:pimeloyl-ACP methyl ester carboxylesterase
VKGRAVLHRIPVEGGSLAVDVLTADTTPALALHGVSSNRELWNWVHAQSPGLSLITPDLRGRADSTGITGPFSLRQHSEDLLRVLDALEIDKATVCGMSMGGFVGVECATTHPDRVSNLVLVDGGFPMAARKPMHAPVCSRRSSSRR